MEVLINNLNNFTHKFSLFYLEFRHHFASPTTAEEVENVITPLNWPSGFSKSVLFTICRKFADYLNLEQIYNILSITIKRGFKEVSEMVRVFFIFISGLKELVNIKDQFQKYKCIIKYLKSSCVIDLINFEV